MRDAVFWVVGRIGPHDAAKYPVEAAVGDSDLDTVVLLPSSFSPNDLLWRKPAARGLLAAAAGRQGREPGGRRDIGEAAVRGLLGELSGGTYPLVGPVRPLSGPDGAAVWARVLGREVTYAGDDPYVGEQAVGERMAPRMGADFRATYQLIQRLGLSASIRQLDATRTAFGREPQDYETLVRHTVEQWSS